MPSSSLHPTWSLLSYTVFDRYFPLIKRWIAQSQSNILHTKRDIEYLFIKIFYIAASESNLKPDYSTFFKSEFIRTHNIKKSQLPKNLTKFSDIFNIQFNKGDDKQIHSFYLITIHRIFKSVAEKLGIQIKSELKKPLYLTFIKFYELKMFVDMIYSDFSEIRENYLRYGGITALFSEFLTNYSPSSMSILKNRYDSSHKLSGSIFTPLWIIELIFDRITTQVMKDPTKTSPITVGDLAVGYGGFLEPFLDNPNYILHGYDKDAFKIDLLKLNHALLQVYQCYGINIEYLTIQDSLLQQVQQQFDILIGNPPWGATLNKANILNIQDLTEFAVKQYDSFGLFLIRNILSLKENGFLFLVLPETLLLNPNYTKIRRFLLENTSLLEIFYLGEKIFENVNMPAIIIGLQKREASPAHSVDIYLVKNSNIEGKPINITDFSRNIIRLQQDFTKNDGYELDIFTTEEERKIIERIDNLPCYQLHELVDNSRGVEIGKKGEVIQCYHCNVWMPVPTWSLDSRTGTKFAYCSVCKQHIFLNKLKNRDRIILDDKPTDISSTGYIRFLIGENIQKYGLTGNKYLLLNRRGIKYKSAKIYEQPRILIRKTSRELLATIDYDNSYVIQVVYQFSLKKQFSSTPFLLEFILGILSSHLIQFIYAKKFQYTHRKSFPHHIQKNILSLPIPRMEYAIKDHEHARYYAIIIYSILILMLLTHFKTYGGINETLEKKLTEFFKENPNIKENIHQIMENKVLLLTSSDQIKQYPFKLQNVSHYIEKYQYLLDQTVEQLFLALE